jgi:TPR repeat protein
MPPDLAVAGTYFGKACDLGLSQACPGASQLAQDEEHRVGYVKKGCDAKDASSCAELGHVLVDKGGADAEKGRQLLEKTCADRSNAVGAGVACAQLGHTYELGQGVPANIAKAVELYTKACELNPTQCALLGDCHLRGTGVQKSKPKAKELYGRACKAGNPDGCQAVQAIDQDQSFGGISSEPPR